MIGLLPVNSGSVNDAGNTGVWHVASAEAVAAAIAVAPESTRVRRPGKVTAPARASSVIATTNTRLCAADGLARAIKSKAEAPRNVVADATALARAQKIKAGGSATRTAYPLPALARCFASPAAMLLNAGYLTLNIMATAAAIATVHVNAIRHGRSAYTVASANPSRARLSGRKTLRGLGIAAANPSRATGVRNRVAAAVAALSASSVVSAVVAKILSASASVQAIKRRAVVGFMQYVNKITPTARVLAPAIQMVTWMFVHEPDYRTVFVRSDASTTRMRTFRKQPAEVLPYDVDFAEWLTMGDDIESAQVHVDSAINGDPADLTIGDVVLLIQNPEATNMVAATRLKVWLSGGVAGATYKITVRADTEGGRRKEVDFRLNVREV